MEGVLVEVLFLMILWQVIEIEIRLHAIKDIFMDQEAKQAVYCLADRLMDSLLFYERLLPYGLDIRRTYFGYWRKLYRT